MRRGSQAPVAGSALTTALVLSAALTGCSSQPTALQREQQQADQSRLSLVGTAIKDGPTPSGSGVDEGGGAAIVRADQPFAQIHLTGLTPGRFTVKALCLGRGTVRITVAPDAQGSAATARATSATVACGFSETFFGADIATGVLGASGVAVSMRAIGESDGAVAFRVRNS